MSHKCTALVAIIEASTAANLIQLGNIQLAKYYALGPTFIFTCASVSSLGNDWKEVTQHNTEVLPDSKADNEKTAKITTRRRKAGEL